MPRRRRPNWRGEALGGQHTPPIANSTSHSSTSQPQRTQSPRTIDIPTDHVKRDLKRVVVVSGIVAVLLAYATWLARSGNAFGEFADSLYRALGF